MGRRAQGGWVVVAADMAEKRAEAVHRGDADPVAVVAHAFAKLRPHVKRLLDNYDLVTPDLERLEIKGSFGSVEAWRRLSAIDPQRAASMRDDVLTGMIPLSAINEAVANARASMAVSAEVVAMDIDTIVKLLREETAVPRHLEPPRGFGVRIPVDLEYREVFYGPRDTDEMPQFDPSWALLISPWVHCSRSRGASSTDFALSVLMALGMFHVVIVASSSTIEADAMMRDLAECHVKPSRLRAVVLKLESASGSAIAAGA